MLKFILIAVWITFAAGKTPHVRNVKGKAINRRSDILPEKEAKRQEPATVTNVTLGEEIVTNHKALNSTEPAVAKSSGILPQKEAKRPEPAPVANVTLAEEIVTNHKALNSTEPAVARSPDILPQKETKGQEPAPVPSAEPAVARSPDYHELIKDFGREVKINDCNSAIDMAKVDFNLRDIIGTDVSSHLNDLTEGFIQGETQFTPRSSFSVNHCDKLFFFENLRSKGFKYDESVRLPDDQPLNLVFNYVDMHKYMSDSRTNPTVVEIPHVTVDGRGSIEMDGDPDYRFELNKSSRKKSGIADRASLLIRRSSSGTPALKNAKLAIPIPDTAGMSGLISSKKLVPVADSEETKVLGRSLEYLYEKYKLYDKDVYLFCKKDLLFITCAYLGYYKRLQDAPTFYRLKSLSSLSTWGKCFMQFTTVMFQSSKYFIEGELDLQTDIKNGINESVWNKNPSADFHVRQPAAIFPGTCYRSINTNWPTQGSDTVINIFPYPTHYIMTFPDYPPSTIYSIIEKTLTKCRNDRFVTKKLKHVKGWLESDTQKISIDYIKIGESGNDINLSLKPTNQTEKGENEFQLIPALKFTVIRTTSIVMGIQLSDDRTDLSFFKSNDLEDHIHGKIEEDKDDEMLGSKFDFSLNGKMLCFDLEVPSSKHAILGLKIEEPHAGYMEADGNGYLTPFRSLQNVSFETKLTMEYDVTQKSKNPLVSFTASAILEKLEPLDMGPNEDPIKDPIEDLKFRMDYEPSTYVASTCFYTERDQRKGPEKISAFIDAVQQKVFFEQDWISFGQIGVTLSPTQFKDLDKTNVPAICKNTYLNSAREEIVYDTEKVYSIRNHNDVYTLLTIKDFGPSFEINFSITLDPDPEYVGFIKETGELVGNVKYFRLVDDLSETADKAILPVVFLTTEPPYRMQVCLMNDDITQCIDEAPVVELNKKFRIKLIQTRTDGFYYQLKAFVDFEEIGTIRRSHLPTVMQVSVQSDNGADGEIQDLEIKAKTDHVFAESHLLSERKLGSKLDTFNVIDQYTIRFDIYMVKKGIELVFGQKEDRPSKLKIQFNAYKKVKVCKITTNSADNCAQKIPYKLDEWTSIRITQTSYDDGTKWKIDVIINGMQLNAILSDTPVKVNGTTLVASPPEQKLTLFRNWLVTDIVPKIGVQIHGLYFDCPASKLKGKRGEIVKSKSCDFLKNNADGQQELYNLKDVKMKGWMDDEDMFVEGETKVPLMILNRFRFSRTANVILTRASLTFIGDMSIDLNLQEPEEFTVTLRMYGDVIDLHISHLYDEEWPIKATIASGIFIGLIFRDRFVLTLDNTMRITEMANDPKVGLGDIHVINGIWFQKRSLTHVVIRQNDFDVFACKERLRQVKFRTFMRTLEKPNQKGFLEGSYITDLCIGKSNTVKHAAGKYFRAGFSLNGNITTTFGRSGDLPFTLPLETRFPDSLCVMMPPLRWGHPTKGNIKSEDEGEPEPVDNQKKKIPPSIEEKEKNPEFGDEIRAVIVKQAPAIRAVGEDYVCEFNNIRLDRSTREHEIHVQPKKDETFVSACVAKCYETTGYDGVKYKLDKRREPYTDQCFCLQGISYPKEETTIEYQSCVITANEDYPVEMFSSAEKETVGPKLCHYINKYPARATLSGYLRTFLFEYKDAEFHSDVDTNRGWFNSYEWNVGGPILLYHNPQDGPIYGHPIIKLEKKQGMRPIDPESMKMSLYITFSNFHGNIQHRLKQQLFIFHKKLSVLEDTMEEFRNTLKEKSDIIQDEISTYMQGNQNTYRQGNQNTYGQGNQNTYRQGNQNTHRQGNQNTHRQGNQNTHRQGNQNTHRQGNQNTRYGRRFEIAKIELARAIKSFKRDCSYECGYEKYPGWVIDKKCSTNQNGGHMSCIRQKRDGNIASDVNCISNCEAERARSYADARELQKRTNEAAEIIDEKKLCEQDGYQLKNKLTDYMTQAEDKKKEITDRKHLIHPDRITQATVGARYISSIVLDIEDVQLMSVKHTQCQNLTVTTHYRRTDNPYICFDAFYKELALHYRDEMIPVLSKSAKDYLEAAEKNAAVYRTLLSRRSRSDESKALADLTDKWKFCSEQGGKSKSPRRSSVMDTAPPFYPVDFATYEAGTEEAFEYTSPWKVAEKRDVTFDLSQVDLLTSKKAVSLPKNESSCSATKRTVNDFNDIASYIQRWTNEYQKAKDNIEEINQRNNDPKSFVWHSVIGNTSYPEEYVMLMKRWHTKAEDGMKRWYELETDHLSRFNKESLPSIRKQLQYMYTDNEHKTLRDFFNARNVDGKTAIQRQHIANATDDTFTNLSKTLLDILENGKSLTDIAATVETVMHNTAQLQKRTIQC